MASSPATNASAEGHRAGGSAAVQPCPKCIEQMPQGAQGLAEIPHGIMLLLLQANATLTRSPDAALEQIREAGALLAAHLDQKGARSASEEFARGGLSQWQVRHLKEHIATRLDERVNVESLAEVAGLSVGHFCRAFKVSFGMPPHTYVTEQRLHKAKRLMLSGEERLAEIAIACGFGDQAHFSHIFRQRVGHSPAHWRRRHRQAARPDRVQTMLADS